MKSERRLWTLCREGEPGDDICWAFLQSSGEQDPLHCVIHRFPQLSKDEILVELMKRNLISSEEKTHFVAMNLSAHQSEVLPGVSSAIWLQKLFLQAACIQLCLNQEVCFFFPLFVCCLSCMCPCLLAVS